MALKKFVTGALAAATLASTLAVAPAAEAQRYGNGYGYGNRGVVVQRYNNRNRYDGGDLAVAGIAGLAIGAIIGSAASQPRYAAPPPPAYYGPPPPAYYAPRWCRTTDWVWDPYYGRRVPVERSYRC